MSKRKTPLKDSSIEQILDVDPSSLDEDAWVSAADALAEALAQSWEDQAELDAAARKRLSVLRKPSGRWVTASDRTGRDPQD